MSCEFNGDLNSFRELEGYVNMFQSSHPDCDDFKKLLKITRPDKPSNYDCVNRAVGGYLTYLKGNRDTDTSFKHFKDLSNEVILNQINGNTGIDTGIFTNPIKTASFIKFCTLNDIKYTFGLDYHNMNINDGKKNLFPTYTKFLNDYPFLNEVEGPIKYKLHLNFLLYGYMKQYCLFDYVLCYSEHLNEYYTNPNYLLGSKSRKSRRSKGSRKSKRASKRASKRIRFAKQKGGAVQSAASAQVPGVPGFSGIPALGLSAVGQARAQQQGLTHTDRDAVARRSPLYIYIVNSPLYSSLSVTSLTVAGSVLFGTVASFSSPFMADLLSTTGTLKKSAQMIVTEFPNEFDFIDLSKRGILATSSKIGVGLGAAISAFFIGAGNTGAFEDSRIVALPRISSGYLSGLWDRLRFRPAPLRRVKTNRIDFTKNAKNMTNKESRGVYSHARLDRLKAELTKFHLFIINDRFITDQSVQQFRLLFKEYVWTSMCLQFEDRVNDLVHLKKMDIISDKRNDLQYVSFEQLAYQRPPAVGLGAEAAPRPVLRDGGCIDPVLNVPMGELSPEEQFAANRRIAQSLGIDSVAKWQAMDHAALSMAQQTAMNTIKLTPEEIDQIHHSCRQKVSELIVKTGERYLQAEITKGERGVEFYEACNDVLDLSRSDEKLKESVRSVASSVFIIEQNMNLVLPKKVTIPMSSFFLMMASAWSMNDMRTGALPFSRHMLFWHFTQIIMSMRTLALFYELGTIVSIREKPDPVPKNAPKNEPLPKNAPKNAPKNEPKVEPEPIQPDIRLGPLLKSQIEASSALNKEKSLLTKAMDAVRKAKILAEENMEELNDATDDVYDELLKEATKSNQSLDKAKNTLESVKQKVEEASANYKKIVDEVASIAAENAKKAEEEVARRIAEQASKKLEEQARRAAFEAKKLAEETSSEKRSGKPAPEKVLSKRYKELLKVSDYFHKGKKIEDIPKLLYPERSGNQLKIADRHMDLWKDGGEFFGQYTEEEMKEEKNFRLLLERWIISSKKGAPGRVQLWLNKRTDKCNIIQDAAKKAAEAAETARKAAEAARKAKEGTGSMFSRIKNAAAATAESVKDSASFKIPTLDKCAQWYGAETYYKFYFSMISGIFYVLTNRKFYEFVGRYLTQNASQEIMDAGVQILQVIGFGMYHGRTLTSTVTLACSLKSMFTTYTDFSRDMTSRTAGMETGLRPYKFEMSVITNQIDRNQDNGGELFRSHTGRIGKVSEQKNRLQDGISKAIDDIRAKAEDARKAYDSQQKDYVVRLKEIESARENARVVMEQKTLEARQAELKLSQEQNVQRERQMEFQKQSLELQQKQEERNARQEESSREIEKVRTELEREKIDIARSAQAQSAEQSAQLLRQAQDDANASMKAIEERARLDDARLAMQEKALGIQAAANESSLKNGENQIHALTQSMASLNNTIATALQSLTQHQERMVALQSGEGRQLHEQGRIIGEMNRQLRDLNDGSLGAEDLRAASILSGVDNPRINDAESEIARRRLELNGFPNAPKGDPRIAANAGTGSSRKAIGVSNSKRASDAQKDAEREAAKREAEKMERLRQAQLSLSSGPMGPYAGPGLAGPVSLVPGIPGQVVKPLALGPAPAPITNANFVRPVLTVAKTPPRVRQPFNSAEFQAAAAADFSNSPVNTNAAVAFLKAQPVIDVDFDEVKLRERLLKYNGVQNWRWDFTVESYEEYIVRTDELLNPNPSSEKDRHRQAKLIARNAQNFSEFQEHEPGKKPEPQEPSKLKKYMSHFTEDEKLDAVKKFLDLQEKDKASNKEKRMSAKNSRPLYVPSVSQLESIRQSRLLALNRRPVTEQQRQESLAQDARLASARSELAADIALLRSNPQAVIRQMVPQRANGANANRNRNGRGTRNAKGKGSKKSKSP